MIHKLLFQRLPVVLAVACFCSAADTNAQVLPQNNDVVLYMNVATGATRIQNDGQSSISIDSYLITSTAGDTTTSLLNQTGWTPLDTEPSLVGSAETANPAEPWDVLSSAINAQRLVEVNRTSNLELMPGESQAIGNVLTTDINFISQHQIDSGGLGSAYLTPFTSFVFTDDATNTQFQGQIEFEDTLLNNLVLEVNTVTGATTFINESTFDVEIDFIEILSDNGDGNSLNPGGYDGFDGVPGLSGDWQFDPTNNSVGAIREFFPGDGTTPDQGEEFAGRTTQNPQEVSLGDLFSAGSGDEDLSFSVHFVGEVGTYTGAVRYVTDAGTPGTPGDYNDDSTVSAGDYAIWRDSLGSADDSVLQGNGDAVAGVGPGDFDVWADNFGASSAALGAVAGSVAGVPVPEPSSAWIVLATIASLGGIGRKK